ncbi:MAG: hypothetical protein HZA54_06990 [Planctomycetes bacterium]|nr:hypothetical protein [Planctomycetota bacterium]
MNTAMRPIARTMAGMLLLGVCAARAGAETPEEKLAGFLQKYDKNGDARVARAEQPEDQKEFFAKIDANKDGVISKQEAKEYFRNLKDATKKPKEDPKKKGAPMKRREVHGIESFGECDADHDGKFDPKEFAEYVFFLCDRNTDGYLDVEELNNLPSSAKRPYPREGMAKRLLKDLDKNADSFVSLEEWKAPEELMAGFDDDRDGWVSKDELIADQLERAGGLAGWSSADEVMAKMDANKDGKLTKEEWQGSKALWDRFGPSPEGLVTKEQVERHLGYLAAILRASDGFVQRHDRNGDRRVTRDEYGGPDAVFERADANRDGVVTVEDGAAGR